MLLHTIILFRFYSFQNFVNHVKFIYELFFRRAVVVIDGSHHDVQHMSVLPPQQGSCTCQKRFVLNPRLPHNVKLSFLCQLPLILENVKPASRRPERADVRLLFVGSNRSLAVFCRLPHIYIRRIPQVQSGMRRVHYRASLFAGKKRRL